MRRLSVLALAVLIALPLSGLSYAAGPPSIAKIGSFYPEDPSRLAVDGAGRVYALSMPGGMISVYNHRYEFLRYIPVERPSSIAVSPSGVLFVGTGEGKIYFLGGEGLELFAIAGNPVSMGFGPDGDLYVLDAKDSTVKVYSVPDGGLKFTFGGAGTADGLFRGAVSLALTQSEVFVLDMGRTVTDGYGGQTPSARIQAFGLSGSFKRSFGANGIGDGKLASPVCLATDVEERLYVSDAVGQVVQVLDGEGNHLLTLYDKANPFKIPNNVVYRDAKLYVNSATVGRVDVFGVDERHAVLGFSPPELSFQAQPGFIPPAGEITLTNSGPGSAIWRARATDEWIRIVSGESGILEGNGFGAVSVTVDVSGLLPGIYTGAVEISIPGAVELVDVTLEVRPLSGLFVNPVSFSLDIKKSDSPVVLPIAIGISDDLAGGLSWSAASDSPWLSVTPDAGASNILTVAGLMVNHTGFPASGRYEGNLTISGGALLRQVPVAVNYMADGAIRVTTNLDEAAFTITGPRGTYAGTGREALFTEVPEGAYTITYGPVNGFSAPPGTGFNVVFDETVSVGGNYTALSRTTVSIIASPDNPWFKDVITIFDGAGTPQGTIRFPNVKVSVRDTLTGDVDGDGVDEIIITLNISRWTYVWGVRADGRLLPGFGFKPFDNPPFNIALGDVDGDGVDEIIAAAGPGDVYPIVKVFKYDGQRVFYDAQMTFLAGKTKQGALVAAADIDGDGVDEIVTVSSKDTGKLQASLWKPSPGGVFASIGGFDVNTNQWRAAIRNKQYRTPSLVTGDLDGDGTSEIVLATEIDPDKGSFRIQGYDRSGKEAAGLVVYSVGGLNVALGDVDGDGADEIVLGDGYSSKNSGEIRIFEKDGRLAGRFSAFGFYGVKVSVGRLGY